MAHDHIYLGDFGVFLFLLNQVNALQLDDLLYNYSTHTCISFYIKIKERTASY